MEVVISDPRGCAEQQDLVRSGSHRVMLLEVSTGACRCFGGAAAQGYPTIRLLPRLKTSPSLDEQSQELLSPPRGWSFHSVPVHPWQHGLSGSLYFSCFSSYFSLNAAKAPGSFPPASRKEKTNSDVGKWL